MLSLELKKETRNRLNDSIIKKGYQRTSFFERQFENLTTKNASSEVKTLYYCRDNFNQKLSLNRVVAIEKLYGCSSFFILLSKNKDAVIVFKSMRCLPHHISAFHIYHRDVKLLLIEIAGGEL